MRTRQLRSLQQKDQKAGSRGGRARPTVARVGGAPRARGAVPGKEKKRKEKEKKKKEKVRALEAPIREIQYGDLGMFAVKRKKRRKKSRDAVKRKKRRKERNSDGFSHMRAAQSARAHGAKCKSSTSI